MSGKERREEDIVSYQEENMKQYMEENTGKMRWIPYTQVFASSSLAICNDSHPPNCRFLILWIRAIYRERNLSTKGGSSGLQENSKSSKIQLELNPPPNRGAWSVLMQTIHCCWPCFIHPCSEGDSRQKVMPCRGSHLCRQAGEKEPPSPPSTTAWATETVLVQVSREMDGLERSRSHQWHPTSPAWAMAIHVGESTAGTTHHWLRHKGTVIQGEEWETLSVLSHCCITLQRAVARQEGGQGKSRNWWVWRTGTPVNLPLLKANTHEHVLVCSAHGMTYIKTNIKLFCAGQLSTVPTGQFMHGSLLIQTSSMVGENIYKRKHNNMWRTKMCFAACTYVILSLYSYSYSVYI